ncbi:MAG: hypothetical protein QM296_02945 [Bacillota bacterium]|nr:hypothetical protein [Bacillota bacterium]
MPQNPGRNEKIVQAWPKKTVCARKPGHKPRFLARGGQKMRWCPETRAETKKLSTGGQKIRWCPETRAGAKKLTRCGQKRPFVPANWGTNPDFWPRVDKKCAGAPKSGQKQKTWPQPLTQLAVQHRRFLFFIRHHKAAANESIGGSRTGDICCGCPEEET